MLWSLGLEGISTSPLTSSIVAGGVFVMVVILLMLLVTNMGGLAEPLITLGFLSFFFFLYLLRLLT